MERPRDLSRRSWRLKLARAEHHMRELEIEFGRYASRHPYEATRLHDHETDERRWKWKLRITEQPDPWLAIITGDVLTNYRAALDHIAGGLAPNWKQPYFPLVADLGHHTPSPTAEQAKEHEKGRKTWAEFAKRVPADAATYIEGLQPYHVAPSSMEGHPQVHAPLELNRLVQADKHRRLVPIVTSLDAVRSFLVYETKVLTPGWFAPFADEGTVVATITHEGQIPPAHKMEVKVSGTPRVTVKLVEGYGNNDLLAMMRGALLFLRDDMFPVLEQFVP